MKKFFALFVCAVMLFASTGALAAVGDVTLNTSADSGEGEDDIYFSGGLNVAVGDTVYLMDYSGSVYTVRPGETELTRYALDQRAFEEAGQSVTPCAFFADEGALKGIFYVYMDAEEDYRFLGAALYKVTLSDGIAVLEKERDLDWDDMTTDYGDGDLFPNSLERFCYNGGKLFVTYYDDDTGAQITVIMDLKTGDLQEVDLERLPVTGVTAYGDGFMLLISDYDNHCTILASLDAEFGDVTELSRENWTDADYVNTGAPVYDAEGDRVFYCEGKALYCTRGTDLNTKEVICDMPAETWGGGAMYLDGGYYAMASDAVVAIRNIDKSKRPTERLTIMTRLGYNTTVNKAFYEFLNTHGEIDPVVMDLEMTDTSVLESFMNRDDTADVYIMAIGSPAFTTLYKRGYMAAIDSKALMSSVEDMYPVFRDLCVNNGALVCYPLEVYSTSVIGLNTEAFEKLGISLDSVPGDWTGFLKWCGELNAQLGEDSEYQVFEPYNTQRYMRQYFINMILQDYMLALTRSGQIERGFNSPELREALNAVAEMDLEAMGIPEDIDWENWDYDQEEKETLVSTWGEYLLRDLSWAGVWTAKGLSVGEGEPNYTVNGYAAFINPYSRHKEAATEFLETIAGELEPAMRYTFSPVDNAPIRASYYESNLEYYTTTMENVQAQIEKAESAEQKRELEEYLADLMEEFEYFLKNAWDVSEEGLNKYYKFVDRLVIRFSSLLDQESLSTMMTQAANGEIGMDAFISNLDRQLTMMLQEGN